MISIEVMIALSINLKPGAINIHFSVEWYHLCTSCIIHDIVYNRLIMSLSPNKYFTVTSTSTTV